MPIYTIESERECLRNRRRGDYAFKDHSYPKCSQELVKADVTTSILVKATKNLMNFLQGHKIEKKVHVITLLTASVSDTPKS